MNEQIVLLLPPAVGLTGMRLTRLTLGKEWPARQGTGLRFAIGLGVGMLAFTQTILLGALIGLNLTAALAWTALIWGGVEFLLLARQGVSMRRQFKFQKIQLWWLLLLPLVVYFWVLLPLSLLEGTLEFDAAVHWLIKTKFLYLKQGDDFLRLMHNPNLAYVHWDYPWLVSAIYTLNYGLLGRVDEFVNKVWPLWMVASLCLGILSLGNVWRRPRPLPILTATIVCYLPGTLRYIHWEGGTIPMLFFASLTALMAIRAITRDDRAAFGATLLLLAGSAMTKFEGMLYAAFWLAVLLPIGRRRGWLGQSLIWKAGTFALLCLLPYVLFRLNGPIQHLESSWPRTVLNSPGDVGGDFPRVLGLGIGHRFFDDRFFYWAEAPDGATYWAGHWEGWSTLSNQQLHVLPWVILILLGFSLRDQRQRRGAILLSLVVLGVFVVVALVIACVAQLHVYKENMILSTVGEGIGRYYFPFFVAWFLGLASAWFREEPATEAPAVQS